MAIRQVSCSPAILQIPAVVTVHVEIEASDERIPWDVVIQSTENDSVIVKAPLVADASNGVGAIHTYRALLTVDESFPGGFARCLVSSPSVEGSFNFHLVVIDILADRKLRRIRAALDHRLSAREATDSSESVTYYLSAAFEYEQAACLSEAAYCLLDVAKIQRMSGDIKEAEQHRKRALSLFVRAGDVEGAFALREGDIGGASTAKSATPDVEISVASDPSKGAIGLPTSILRVGVIGYGYWGPNFARNLQALPSARLVAIAESDERALLRARLAFPNLLFTTDADQLISSSDVDAVVIATPTHTHFELARRALINGKHVLVSTPLASTSEEGEQLINLAAQRNLQLMVDQPFLFTGAVRTIRQLIDDGTLGKVYYYDSVRVNLGLFQSDTNVLWDLAPSDLSILNFLVGERPTAVLATGETVLGGPVDIAYLTLYFPSNVIAHLSVNWLSPVKIRKTLVGGETKMVVWDDLESDEKIKVYDRGISIAAHDKEKLQHLAVSYRSGDMWAPKVAAIEALKMELGYFVDCIERGVYPINDGHSGLRIVQILEAADQSLSRATESSPWYVELD